MDFIFEWDEVKAATNQQKHGVSFTEAQTVFLDPLSITIFDDRHSASEDRFIDIGRSTANQILVVVSTEESNRIRIIRCRPATSAERRHYEQQEP